MRAGHVRGPRVVLHPAHPVQRAPGLLRVPSRVSDARAAAYIGVGGGNDGGGIVAATAARSPLCVKLEVVQVFFSAADVCCSASCAAQLGRLVFPGYARRLGQCLACVALRAQPGKVQTLSLIHI